MKAILQVILKFVCFLHSLFVLVFGHKCDTVEEPKHDNEKGEQV